VAWPPDPLLFEAYEGDGNTFAVDFTDEIAKLVAGTQITASASTAVNHDAPGVDVTSDLIQADSFTATEGRFSIKTTAPVGVYEITMTVTLDAGGPIVECIIFWIRACPTP
jgi:hypothetical protein